MYQPFRVSIVYYLKGVNGYPLMPILTEIELSKRIFCFYALLNAGGYSPEKEIHPVRERTLLFIQERLPREFMGAAREFLAKPETAREYWFPYRTWTLCHGEPPQFEERAVRWKNFLGDEVGENLKNFLVKLWIEYDTAELWEQEKNEYARVKPFCNRNARQAVRISLDYLRLNEQELPFAQFIVIPNFLDEYHRGIGPLIEDTAYALLGPSPDPNDPFPEERIQHEFLHSTVNAKVGEIFSGATDGEKSKLREMLVHSIVLQTHANHREYFERKHTHLLKKNIDVMPLLSILEQYENMEGNFYEFLRARAEQIKEACR